MAATNGTWTGAPYASVVYAGSRQVSVGITSFTSVGRARGVDPSRSTGEAKGVNVRYSVGSPRR
jgi:hypothetical protein